MEVLQTFVCGAVLTIEGGYAPVSVGILSFHAQPQFSVEKQQAAADQRRAPGAPRQVVEACSDSTLKQRRQNPSV
jgi:hypothetical protein